jgi:hypothetical protein
MNGEAEEDLGKEGLKMCRADYIYNQVEEEEELLSQ